MCWSDHCIFKQRFQIAHLCTSCEDYYNGAQTWRICVCSNQPYPGIFNSAVQTPGFSPPAPAPAKKTPAPGKKLRLRQKTCEN